MVNPWFLTVCVILLILGAFFGSFIALILLGVGLMLLILKAFRTWMIQQLYLAIAAIKNLWTKEVTWKK